MNLSGKTNEELLAMKAAICANLDNRNTVPGSLFLYNESSRRKLAAIDWAITANLRSAKLARGDTVNDAGYSGRRTNRRR